MSELTSSQEFTQNDVDDLRGEVKWLKQDKKDKLQVINILRSDLQVKRDKIKELEERSIYQEDYSRRATQEPSDHGIE